MPNSYTENELVQKRESIIKELAKPLKFYDRKIIGRKIISELICDDFTLDLHQNRLKWTLKILFNTEHELAYEYSKFTEEMTKLYAFLNKKREDINYKDMIKLLLPSNLFEYPQHEILGFTDMKIFFVFRNLDKQIKSNITGGNLDLFWNLFLKQRRENDYYDKIFAEYKKLVKIEDHKAKEKKVLTPLDYIKITRSILLKENIIIPKSPLDEYYIDFFKRVPELRKSRELSALDIIKIFCAEREPFFYNHKKAKGLNNPLEKLKLIKSLSKENEDFNKSIKKSYDRIQTWIERNRTYIDDSNFRDKSYNEIILSLPEKKFPTWMENRRNFKKISK